MSCPCASVLHDRDTKFCPTFDPVVTSEGLEIVRTPDRAPHANAIAERWIRSLREEYLDHLLILHERHLWCVLSEDGASSIGAARIRGSLSNPQDRRRHSQGTVLCAAAMCSAVSCTTTTAMRLDR